MTAPLYKRLESNSELEWLVKRQSMVTATDMARMMTGGPIVMSRIAEEKINPPQSLAPTRTLEWGHEREPKIIEAMNRIHGLHLEHNVDVCVRTDEERFGGTPDAISFVEPVIGECKTYSGERFVVTDEHFYQCGWNLYITDSQQCIYGWEEHDDFVPRGDVQTQIIERDQSNIDAMIIKAYDFLDYLSVHSSEANEELDRLIREHEEFAIKEREAKAGKEKIKDQIRLLKGAYNEYGYISDIGSISSSFPKPRSSVNTELLSSKYPEAFKECVTFTPAAKPTLTVTLKKKKNTS